MTTLNELQQKYRTEASFKKEMDKISENYKIMKQQAHYSSLNQMDSRLISKFETERSPIDIYFFYAAYAETKSLEKMTMHFITEIPIPENPFSIVYFNEQDMSSNKFSMFKNMLILLPIQYFWQMHKIYVVRGSLKSRASKYFSFHTMTRYINSQTIDVSSISELCEHLGLQHEEIYKFMPQQIRSSFLDELKQVNENGFAEALKDIIMTSTPQTPTPAGQVTKSAPPAGRTPPSNNSFPRIEIDEYQKSERGLPQILELLIFYFKEHPEGLAEEGVFRKSVSIDEENQAICQLNKKNYRYLDSITSPYLVASLIKKFFAHLATPVIPFEQFDKLMAENITAELICQIVKEIEVSHLTKLLSLMLVLQFLKQQVVPLRGKNKMTTENIAICFGPCLMWSCKKSIQDIVFANKSVRVLMVMLQNFEQIFGNRKKQQALYRNSYVAHTKKQVTEGLMECNSPDGSEEVDILGNRRTPNFGQMILNNASSYLDLLAEDEEVSNENVNFPPSQSQKFKLMRKEENEKDKTQTTSKNMQKQRQFLQPNPRKGIFTSKMAGSEHKSVRSKNSGKHDKSQSEIKSIHSDTEQ